MNWNLQTLFFPLGKLVPELVGEYIARYTVQDVDAVQHTLDGQPIGISPRGPRDWAVCGPDDSPLTRLRRESLPAGTIAPIPVYDPPFTPQGEDDEPDPATLIGHTIRAAWPETFIADIEAGDDPILYGITILP